MEANSIHSTIERAIKNKNIVVPAEYIDICRTARKNLEPYDVTYLDNTLRFCKSIWPE